MEAAVQKAFPSLKPAFDAPLYIAWEATHRCNARCLHCYSSSGPDKLESEEMTTEAAKNMISDLADAGVLVFAFSGGEPLIRKDIYQLIHHAASNGMVVNLASNGALINEKSADKLIEAGVRSVTISLDGPDAETHDHFRQHPGLFRLCIRAIRILVKKGIRVVVSFTPARWNYAKGREVVELAYSLGASAVNMSEYVPAGRGTREMALPPDLLHEVLLEWIDMRREYEGKMQIIWHDCRAALLVPPEERDKYSGCGAGKLTARIMTDGSLTACVFLANPAGNLNETPFREIWNNSPVLDAIRNRDLIGGNCLSCSFKSTCGGCRAVSMAYYGNPLMGDPSCWIKKEAVPSS